MERRQRIRNLAESVRWYLRHFRGNENEQPPELKDVCSALEWLTGELLAGEETWNRYYWVDGVIPTYAASPADNTITIDGFLVCAEKGSSHNWIEPFSASLRLADNKDEGCHYEIKFGDAARGLLKTPYGVRTETQTPEQWIFEFSSSDPDPE